MGLLGSIYGWTREEIEQKITQKLKEVSKHKKKSHKNAVKTPLLSEGEYVVDKPAHFLAFACLRNGVEKRFDICCGVLVEWLVEFAFPDG